MLIEDRVARIDANIKRLRAEASKRAAITSGELFTMTDPLADDVFALLGDLSSARVRAEAEARGRASAAALVSQPEAGATPANVLRELIEAVDAGKVKIEGPEIGGGGDPEIAAQSWPWEDEWLHYARQAVAAPAPSGMGKAVAREIAHAQIKTCAGRPGGVGETASMPRPHSVPCDWLTTEIARAIREAHTAGFNEARDRAVNECRTYEARMNAAADKRAAEAKPCTVATSKASAADDIATAISALKAEEAGDEA